MTEPADKTSSTSIRDAAVGWTMTAMALIILSGIALCAYWLAIDRTAPVTVHGGDIISYEHQPDNSWIMIVKWRGTRHRKCFGNSKRWLANGFWLPLGDIPYPPPSSGTETGDFTWEVPVLVPSYYVSTGHLSGNYAIRILYACNPLQEYLFPIIVDPPPIPFTIPVDAAAPSPDAASRRLYPHPDRPSSNHSPFMGRGQSHDPFRE